MPQSTQSFTGLEEEEEGYDDEEEGTEGLGDLDSILQVLPNPLSFHATISRRGSILKPKALHAQHQTPSLKDYSPSTRDWTLASIQDLESLAHDPAKMI